MRITTLVIILALIQATKLTANDQPDFKRHSFEFSAAAGLDYQFVVKNQSGFEQNTSVIKRPFAGFCFGFQYIYRPISMFGISTGLESLEYGNKTIEIDVSDPPSGLEMYKGYGFAGSMGVPVYLHVYKQISRVTIEFATGPEFFFDVYNIDKYQVSDNDPFYPPNSYSIRNTQYFNKTQIRQSASLAWSVQLMADIWVSKALDVSIGPEWKFLNIQQLAPVNADYSSPRAVPFFLGLKAGFRLGAVFYKKTKA